MVAVALTVMALDGWTVLVGISSGPSDRWAITVAACLFAFTIPAGLGLRILIGIGRIPAATVIQMSCPAVALVITLALYASGGERNLVCGIGTGRTSCRADPRYRSGSTIERLGVVGFCTGLGVEHRNPASRRERMVVRRRCRDRGRTAVRTNSPGAPVHSGGSV